MVRLINLHDETINRVFDEGYTIRPVPIRPAVTRYHLQDEEGKIYGTMTLNLENIFRGMYPETEIKMYAKDGALEYVLKTLESDMYELGESLYAIIND